MQESLLTTQFIRTVQVFYYSSPNDIFINTFIIQVLNHKHIPPNIRIKTTQIPEPSHHIYGQAPFVSINNSQIIKKQSIWQFLFSVLNFKPSRKFQFLSVAYLTEELAQVANIFSEYDQNPYYVFISPWRKYKRRQSLQNKKQWFTDNSLFCANGVNSLNHEYFIYKCNSLGQLMNEYQKPNATQPQFLNIYKILVFALLKHLKIVENTLYLVVSQVNVLKDIENEVQTVIDRARQNFDNNEERPPMRNISFSNVHIKDFRDIVEKQKDQEQNGENDNKREKINQSIFKPIITTFLFTLAMFAFN